MSIVLKNLVVLICMSTLLTATLVPAQGVKYKVDPVHAQLVYPPKPTADSTSQERSANLAATNAVRNNQNLLNRAKIGLYKGEFQLAGQYATQFDTMITSWKLPEMTRYDNESLAELPKLRQMFVRDFFDTPSPQPVHDRLVKDLLYPRLEAIITGEGENEYHPAVRYNAMTIMGRLNEQEAVPTGTGELPVPYAKALKFTVDQFTNPKQLEAVRVAALLGMLGHARMDSQRAFDQRRIDSDTRTAMVSAAMDVLDNKPADRSEGAHHWIQRRAVELLSLLGDVGQGGAVAKKLDEIIKSDTETFSLRLAAASAVPQLRYTAEMAKDVDALDLTRRFAGFAAAVCRGELEWIADEMKREEELLKQSSGDGGYGTEAEAGIEEPEEEEPAFNPNFFSGDFSPSSSSSYETGQPVELALQAYKLVKSRRKMKTAILTIQSAIGKDDASGIRRYAKSAEEKKTIERVADVINALLKATDPPEKKVVDPRRPPAVPLIPEPVVEPTKAFVKAFEIKVQDIENEVRALTPADEVAAPVGLFPGDPAPVEAGPTGPAAPMVPAAGPPPAAEEAAAPEPLFP